MLKYNFSAADLSLTNKASWSFTVDVLGRVKVILDKGFSFIEF